MATWTFIRHGESTANVESWYAGQSDSPLTEVGRIQAAELAQVLRHTSYDRVFASDLSRALETARAIVEGRGLELLVTPRLRERSCGALEGKSVAELERTGALAAFYEFDGRPPGGESLRDVARRVLAYLAEIDAEGRSLVVSHGAVMRATLGVLDGMPHEQIGHWKVGNCEVVERELALGTFAARLRTI